MLSNFTFLLLILNAFLKFLQVATLLAVYATWGFANIRGIGWGWAGVIWLFSIITYLPLDIIKFAVRYILSGKAWDLLIERRVIYIKIVIIWLDHRNRGI